MGEENEIVHLIGQAYRLSRRRMEQAVREHGITRAQFQILMTLGEEPRLSGIEVAARAFISPQAAHSTLATLERKGLVERAEETAHRRMVRTALTDEGARVLNKCLDAVSEVGIDLGRGLPRDRRRALLALLADYLETNPM
jgi:DNA-binding MarR family transcriptional regulator